MFGRKPKITLYEGEEIIDTFKLKPSALSDGGIGITGHFHITDQRIILNLDKFNIHDSISHDDIISFNWGRNIPTDGTRFTILYSYINNFGNQGYLERELRVHDRKKIKKILENYPYYEKPQIIPTVKDPSENSFKGPQNDSLNILKTRYAKGEITKEEFEEMKKDLEI